MQDVKGLKVLQVLPDEGGRTKSLFELCLNFRITISPLENWPPGLIVFGKKKKKEANLDYYRFRVFILLLQH